MNKQDIYDMQRKAFEEGKVLYVTCEGLMSAKIEDLISQDTDGLLYDLNRDTATVLAIFDEQKLMNELATINVLKYLHRIATDDDYCCGGCEHFQNEAADGFGVCGVDDKVQHCDHVCGKCKKKE